MEISESNQIIYSTTEIVSYKSNLINKTFAILGIFEDCSKDGNNNPFNIYIKRYRKEVVGFSQNYSHNNLISIVNILDGIIHDEYINHDELKMLVFHMISLIKKIEVR